MAGYAATMRGELAPGERVTAYDEQREEPTLWLVTNLNLIIMPMEKRSQRRPKTIPLAAIREVLDWRADSGYRGRTVVVRVAPDSEETFMLQREFDGVLGAELTLMLEMAVAANEDRS